MSESILYSPVCFHGTVSKIFKWHGLFVYQGFKCHPVSNTHRLLTVNTHLKVEHNILFSHKAPLTSTQPVYTHASSSQ